MAYTLPTNLKTWNISRNNAVAATGTASAENQQMMLAFKNELVRLGFTVTKSGSGTGGSYNASGDTWTVYTDLRVNSWIELRHTTMGLSLLIVASSSSLGLYYVLGSYAGFSGGSPSATVAPTATDSFQVTKSAGVGAAGWIFGSTTRSYKWHSWASTDGYVIQLVAFSNSVPVCWWRFEKPTAGYALSGMPTIAGIVDQASGGTANRMLLAEWWTSLATFTYAYINNARAQFTGVLESFANGAIQSLTSMNGLDTAWHMSALGIGSMTAGAYYGRHMYLADVWAVASSLQEGDSIPDLTNIYYVVGGDIALPWPGDNVPMQVL